VSGWQHLPVGSVGGGGAVGMQHEAPAVAVDADVVVELAQQHAVGDGGFPAVGLVGQVVHVAPGGGPPAAGPGAAAVAELDGAADAGRDRVGIPDVQRDRRGAVRGCQEGGAEPGGEAGGAGDEVDGEPGDGVAQRLHRVGSKPLPGPTPGPGRGPGSAACGTPPAGIAVAGVVRARVVTVASRVGTVEGDAGRGQCEGDNFVDHPHVGVPGHHRFGVRVARGRLGVLPLIARATLVACH
jgi:hypothetical protein